MSESIKQVSEKFKKTASLRHVRVRPMGAGYYYMDAHSRAYVPMGFFYSAMRIPNKHVREFEQWVIETNVTLDNLVVLHYPGQPDPTLAMALPEDADTTHVHAEVQPIFNTLEPYLRDLFKKIQERHGHFVER